MGKSEYSAAQSTHRSRMPKQSLRSRIGHLQAPESKYWSSVSKFSGEKNAFGGEMGISLQWW